MPKKKSTAGAGPTASVNSDVPEHLLASVIDARDESFDEICSRHARELAEIESIARAFGSSKKDRERALRCVGVVSDRHYVEMRAWEEAHASEVDDDDAAREAEEEEEALAEATRVKATISSEHASVGERRPSKAQARKAKRAAEEEAREARIEAEKAALGPSDEALESDVLRARLAPLGLRVKDIRADGHCLYRAIDDQLASVHGAGHEGGYQGLRRTCARALREDEDAYRPFADDCADDDDKWRTYLHNVESTATWGGQLEIMALAKALGRRIQVFSATMPVVVMGEEFPPEGALRVAYHRHAFGLGEHYNSVESI